MERIEIFYILWKNKVCVRICRGYMRRFFYFTLYQSFIKRNFADKPKRKHLLYITRDAPLQGVPFVDEKVSKKYKKLLAFTKYYLFFPAFPRFLRKIVTAPAETAAGNMPIMPIRNTPVLGFSCVFSVTVSA